MLVCFCVKYVVFLVFTMQVFFFLLFIVWFLFYPCRFLMLSIFFPSVGFWSYLCGDFVTLGVLLYVWFCYMWCGFLLYLCGFCYMCGFCFTCVGIFLPVWDFIYPCGSLLYLCGCCEVLIYLSGSAVSVGQAEVQGFGLGPPS